MVELRFLIVEADAGAGHDIRKALSEGFTLAGRTPIGAVNRVKYLVCAMGHSSPRVDDMCEELNRRTRWFAQAVE